MPELSAKSQFGLPDQDNDGIADIFELYGYESNGNRIDFPGLGANPFRKDIFVEVDVMEGITIPDGAFDDVINAFSNAPLLNLNKSKGASLHIGALKTVPFYDELDFDIEGQGNRKNAQIAVNKSGKMIIVWQDDRDGNGLYQIHANIFNSSGQSLLSGEITINPISDGQQINPDVAINESGNFVVTWQDDRDENGFYEIFARVFNQNGAALTGEIHVNQVSDGQQTNPVVGIDKNTNFFVAWLDDRDGNGYKEIIGRNFNATGTSQSGEITVNPVSDGQQQNVVIAMNGDGEAMLVWEDDRDGNDYFEIYARKLNVSGNLSNNEIHVNSVGDGQQLAPSVAIDDDENFVVAWEDDRDGNGFYQIYARRFENGSTGSAQVKVNAESAGQQRKPVVAITRTGSFSVAWEDDTDGNSYYEIKIRKFNRNGTPVSGEIWANNFSEGQQRYPEIASSENGQLYVCFADNKAGNVWSVRFRILNSIGNIFSAEKTPHTDIRSFESVKEKYFTDINWLHFHYCVIANSRFNTGSSGVANLPGYDEPAQNIIVALGTSPSRQKLSTTFMHELGHNLGLLHGGDDRVNRKPNYLSIMNYRYQFGGADNNCYAESNPSSPEDLSYSRGWNSNLDENALNENIGICKGEKHVNWISSGQQQRPAIDMNNSGRFVIVWQDDFDGNSIYQIYGRTFGNNGIPLSYEKRINPVNSGQQRNPSVGMAGSGNFVVTWDDDRDENGSYEIYAQRCATDGSRIGSEILVNAASGGNQVKPDISVADDGSFVVVWQDDRNNDGSYEVFCRFFSANGNPVSGNVKVSDNSNTNEIRPRVSMNDNKKSVIAWEDDRDGNGFFEIYAQVFKNDFSKLGGEIHVNENSEGQQGNPDVGIAGNGHFAVIWEDDANENGLYQILGRRFDDNRNSIGNQFTINQESDGQQRYPRIAVNNNFEFSVCWQDDRDGNGLYQIFVRNFSASGSALFNERTVNLVADGQQLLPVAGFSDNGESCIVWQDDRDGNNFYELVALRLTSAGNILDRLAIDWNGNGSINSGSVSTDINNDDEKTFLKDHNDWGRIKLNFR